MNASETRLRGILAIETSQSRGSVAWAKPGAAPVEELFPIGLVHGREILSRIDQLSTRAPFNRSEIELVAVSAGPGSFTGARIGVAAGKAIAYALGIPTLAISSLEVVAQNALIDADRTLPEGGECAVILDARRQSVYAARFRRRGQSIDRITEDACLEFATFVASLPAETRLLGEGVRSLEGLEAFVQLPESVDRPRATTVIELARRKLAEIEGGAPPPPEFTDPHSLVPCYLRRTAAEEAREERS